MRIKIAVNQVVAVVVILLPFFACTTVYAHKVSIYAYAEDGRIFAEGYFANGSRVRNSKVTVFNGETGKKFFDISTSESGTVSFKIPEPVSLKLVLNAGMGHEGSYVISRREIREASGLQFQDHQDVKLEEGLSHESVDRNVQCKPRFVGGELHKALNPEHRADSDRLEQIVDRVVEKKLQPVKTMLMQIREATEKPRISEVLGGVGYILGLMGLAMYFKSRK